jgi:hypothetical protein
MAGRAEQLARELRRARASKVAKVFWNADLIYGDKDLKARVFAHVADGSVGHVPGIGPVARRGAACLILNAFLVPGYRKPTEAEIVAELCRRVNGDDDTFFEGVTPWLRQIIAPTPEERRRYLAHLAHMMASGHVTESEKRLWREQGCLDACDRVVDENGQVVVPTPTPSAASPLPTPSARDKTT